MGCGRATAGPNDEAADGREEEPKLFGTLLGSGAVGAAAAAVLSFFPILVGPQPAGL